MEIIRINEDAINVDVRPKLWHVLIALAIGFAAIAVLVVSPQWYLSLPDVVKLLSPIIPLLALFVYVRAYLTTPKPPTTK